MGRISWADILERWEKAETFTRLLNLNKRFLLGKLPETPYYGPLDEETENLIPGLVELHDLRIFTYGSQPYDWDVWQYGSKFCECWHRPFVRFVMADKDEPLRIFEKLRAREDIEVYAAMPPLYNPLNESYDEEMFAIERYREAKSMKELKAQGWYSSSMHPITKYLHKQFEEWCPNAWTKSQPWYFGVVGTSWDKDTDLTRIIAEAARQG